MLLPAVLYLPLDGALHVKYRFLAKSFRVIDTRKAATTAITGYHSIAFASNLLLHLLRSVCFIQKWRHTPVNPAVFFYLVICRSNTNIVPCSPFVSFLFLILRTVRGARNKISTRPTPDCCSKGKLNLMFLLPVCDLCLHLLELFLIMTSVYSEWKGTAAWSIIHYFLLPFLALFIVTRDFRCWRIKLLELDTNTWLPVLCIGVYFQSCIWKEFGKSLQDSRRFHQYM